MVAYPALAPYATTSAYGSFNISSEGYVQGCALDQPSTRNALAGGTLNVAETLPMWGGCGITELIGGAASAPNGLLGSLIGRATTLSAHTTGQLTGFSVFDQNYAAVISPGNPVPLVGTYGQVNFYRLGSGARIPVAISPSLISLQGGLVTQQVSWDFNNQILAPYESTATYALSSVTWSSTNGGQAVIVGSVASPVAGIGDYVNISGATNSGTGGAALVNGNFVVTAFTDSQHFIVAMPGTSSTIGTIAGSPVLNYGTGALPVSVIDLQIGTSMVVSYNALTGVASWNRSGSTAVILI